MKEAFTRERSVIRKRERDKKEIGEKRWEQLGFIQWPCLQSLQLYGVMSNLRKHCHNDCDRNCAAYAVMSTSQKL